MPDNATTVKETFHQAIAGTQRIYARGAHSIKCNGARN